MKRILIASVAIALFGLGLAAKAANYDVAVSRETSNVYRVIGSDTYIHTRWCYEYVHYEDSLLRMHGYGGEIIFLDSGGKCDVKAVYGKADLSPGRYDVTVSHEEDDWYEAWGTNSFIRTSYCLHLGLVSEALLRLDAYGGGSLVFLDGGGNCTVEGVYTRLSL